MQRATTVEGYKRTIELYQYYIDRELIDTSKAMDFMRDREYMDMFPNSLQRKTMLKALRDKDAISKKGLNNNKATLDLYKRKTNQ